MLLHVPLVHSFILQYSRPWYGFTRLLSIHWLADTALFPVVYCELNCYEHLCEVLVGTYILIYLGAKT